MPAHLFRLNNSRNSTPAAKDKKMPIALPFGRMFLTLVEGRPKGKHPNIAKQVINKKYPTIGHSKPNRKQRCQKIHTLRAKRKACILRDREQVIVGRICDIAKRIPEIEYAKRCVPSIQKQCALLCNTKNTALSNCQQNAKTKYQNNGNKVPDAINENKHVSHHDFAKMYSTRGTSILSKAGALLRKWDGGFTL